MFSFCPLAAENAYIPVSFQCNTMKQAAKSAGGCYNMKIEFVEVVDNIEP